MLYSGSPFDSLEQAALIGGFFKYSLIRRRSFSIFLAWHGCFTLMFKVLSSFFYLFWNGAGVAVKTLPCVSQIDYIENVRVHLRPVHPRPTASRYHMYIGPEVSGSLVNMKGP